MKATHWALFVLHRWTDRRTDERGLLGESFGAENRLRERLSLPR
jgi:hypothetical protein